MARIRLDKRSRMKDHLCDLIVGKMKRLHIRQTDIARELGISQVAVGKKIKNRQFTFEDLIVLFEILQFTPDEVGQVMLGG